MQLKKIIQILGLLFIFGNPSLVWAKTEFDKELVSANQGNSDAQNNIGVMYKNGLSIRQDYAKAME